MLPGQTDATAETIDGFGRVIVNGTAPTGSWHAFAWQNGHMTDLGALGGRGSGAVAINNHNQIVGWATTKTGEKHAVLSTLRSG